MIITDDNETIPDRGDELPDDDTAADDKAAAAAAKGDEDAGDDDPDKTPDEQAEEETDEEKAERLAAELEAEKAKRQRIPLNRHKDILEQQRTEALAREQQLAQRIKQLERESQPAPTQKDPLADLRKELATKQDEYEELIFAGEKDQARALRVKIDEMREQYSDAKAAMTSQATRAATIDSLKYEQALAAAEAAHPAINPDGDAFDEAKANEVAELMNMFQTQGMTRQASLQKAVKYVLGEPKAVRTDTVADTLGKKREQEARQRAAKASTQQPPAANGIGKDNDTTGAPGPVDVMRLGQDRFDKLEAAALEKLDRGDEVA